MVYVLHKVSGPEDTPRPVMLNNRPATLTDVQVHEAFLTGVEHGAVPCEFEGDPTNVYRIGHYVFVPEQS